MTAPVDGICPDNFRAVEHAFRANLDSDEDLGASVCVYIDGEKAIDLWGGWQDRQKTIPMAQNSLACIYSTGKAIIALLVADAVEQGLLDYDQPIVSWWPDFGQAGKESITLAQILSHQAGLCGIAEETDPAIWVDWQAVCRKLASMAPLWVPGTANGYGPQTFGHLAGEVLRRVTGKTIGVLLQEKFADIHQGNLYCGVPESELPRVVRVGKPPRAPDLGELNEFTQIAFLKKWSSVSGVSHEQWLQAEIPASNMQANASGVASLLSIVANKGQWHDQQILSIDTLEQMRAERCRRDDLVLPFNLSWAAGMMRNTNGVYGPVESTLGQSGFGGSLGFADSHNRISFAYVMNKMQPTLMGDDRAKRLIDALYESV